MTFATFVVYGAVVACQDSRQSSAVRDRLWGLEVLTFEATSPKELWVGLVNRSNEARLACITDQGIRYKEKSGASKFHTEGLSPHGCDVDAQFQLVRAGQTYFVRLAVPATLPAQISGRVRVEVGLVDSPVANGVSGRQPSGVNWEGTLQDAADLGRSVSTPKNGK